MSIKITNEINPPIHCSQFYPLSSRRCQETNAGSRDEGAPSTREPSSGKVLQNEVGTLRNGHPGAERTSEVNEGNYTIGQVTLYRNYLKFNLARLLRGIANGSMALKASCRSLGGPWRGEGPTNILRLARLDQSIENVNGFAGLKDYKQGYSTLEVLK
jgi:hypothetical protein